MKGRVCEELSCPTIPIFTFSNVGAVGLVVETSYAAQAPAALEVMNSQGLCSWDAYSHSSRCWDTSSVSDISDKWN
jgi:hypothetical protein